MAGTRELRGREAGEKRAGSASSKRAGSGREMRNANYYNLRILSKTSTQIIFDLHLTSSRSLLRLPRQRANENLSLG